MAFHSLVISFHPNALFDRKKKDFLHRTFWSVEDKLAKKKSHRLLRSLKPSRVFSLGGLGCLGSVVNPRRCALVNEPRASETVQGRARASGPWSPFSLRRRVGRLGAARGPFRRDPGSGNPPVQRHPAGGDAQTSSELWRLVNGSTTLDRDKERGRRGGLSNGHASPGAWPLSLRDGCPPRLGGGRSSRGRVRPQSWGRGPSGQAFPLGALSSPRDRLLGGLRTVPCPPLRQVPVSSAARRAPGWSPRAPEWAS